jgi:hypothetical protein
MENKETGEERRVTINSLSSMCIVLYTALTL